MDILKQFSSIEADKVYKIGIGLGNSEKQNEKILDISIKSTQANNTIINLFGTREQIKVLSQKMGLNQNQPKLVLKGSEDPEKVIIESLKREEIHALIRGSLSSSKFLSNLKTSLNIKKLNRLALLETVQGFQFFYGPVGIDECNSLESKKDFITEAIELIEKLHLIPKISVLSGGREDDLGRDERVDKTIKEAIQVVQYFKQKDPNLAIFHDEILIENAIERKANLIIAPDGISGNLIYRTLVHLGGGKAYGAIYMGLRETIIDTSRVGHETEINGALKIALALLALK